MIMIITVLRIDHACREMTEQCNLMKLEQVSLSPVRQGEGPQRMPLPLSRH